MDNLKGNELKNKFLECLLLADKSDAEFVEIKFKFKSYDNYNFNSIVIKRSFCGYQMNNLSLYYFENNKTNPSKDIVFNIIIHNMSYDQFNLIDTNIIKGERECCGHGEYYKTDKYIFTFYRFKKE